MFKSEVLKRLEAIKEIDIKVSNNSNCSKEFRKDAECDAVAVDMAINSIKADKKRTIEFYKGIGIASAIWIVFLFSIGMWKVIKCLLKL